MSRRPQKLPDDYVALLVEVKERVRASQYKALRVVNKELVALYWDIGEMLVRRQRAGSRGDAVVKQLARDLQTEFPGVSGYSWRNLFYMSEFYAAYRDLPKLQPLVATIGWSHNLVILQRCKDPQEREFYIRMTRKFGWSKAVLIHQIENQSYEKTLLGQTNFHKALTPKLRAQAKLAVKDEYTFDFLELGEEHAERELERALVGRIEHFLREMGGLFAFVGKMQFYLTALDRQIREKGENRSIGIILCKEKNRTVVEYALYEASKPIGVATYRIVKRLPKEFKGELPTPAEIVKLLEDGE